MTKSVVHSLSRVGKLAVCVFALLLLPFAPTWGAPQDSNTEKRGIEKQAVAKPNDESPGRSDAEDGPIDQPLEVPDQRWQLDYLIAQNSKKQDSEIEERIKLYERAFVAQTKLSALLKDGIKLSVRRNDRGEGVVWLRFEDTNQLNVGLPIDFIHYATLQGSTFTDESIDAISKLRQLKQLELRNTTVSHLGIARLEKTLPKCRFRRSVSIKVGYLRENEGTNRDREPHYFIGNKSLTADKINKDVRTKIIELIRMGRELKTKDFDVEIYTEKDVPSEFVQRLIQTCQEVGLEKFSLHRMVVGNGRDGREDYWNSVQFTISEESKSALLPNIRVKVTATKEGALMSISLGQRNLGTAPAALNKLSNEILKIIGKPGNPLADDLVVEIEADPQLRITAVMSVISHATGRTALTTRKRIVYINKVKLVIANQAPHTSADNNSIRTRIQAARKFLVSHQQDNGRWLAKTPQFEVGMTALCTLALLKSGSKPNDPAIKRALKYLRQAESELTYEVGLQALALAAARQKQDLLLIRRCAKWLEEAQVTGGVHHGGWTYRRANDWARADNSNSEMAVWALQAVEQAGVAVNKDTWKRAYDYWKRAQREDGSWGYIIDQGSGSGSMTCSGIASLAICAEQLNRPKDDSGVEIKNGLDWIKGKFRVGQNPNYRAWYFYYLVMLRRAGDLALDKPFEDHSWYRSTVRQLEAMASETTGEWRGNSLESDPILSTSFVLLFLSSSK